MIRPAHPPKHSFADHPVSRRSIGYSANGYLVSTVQAREQVTSRQARVRGQSVEEAQLGEVESRDVLIDCALPDEMVDDLRNAHAG